MVNVNDPQVMRAVGIPTKTSVIHKIESHKLAQAFPVKKNGGKVVEVIPGMPVKLNTDGTIEPYVGSGVYLGIAITDSLNPAYPEGAVGPEVTVIVEAFAVVYGIVDSTVDSELNCGGVTPSAIGSDYESTYGEENSRDPKYIPYKADAVSTDPKFINITPGASAGDLIQVIVK